MTRYVQKILLGGKERWFGWEVDGVGTEVAGLVLAEGISEEELRAKGVRKFVPMSFDDFIGLGAMTSNVKDASLDDQDLDYRFDALQVAIDRFHAQGYHDVPKLFLEEMFGENGLRDSRVESRLQEWERSGVIELSRADERYIRILRRFT